MVACAFLFKFTPLEYTLSSNSSSTPVRSVLSNSSYADFPSLKESISTAYPNGTSDAPYDRVRFYWTYKTISLLEYLRYCNSDNLDVVLNSSVSLEKNTERIDYNGVFKLRVDYNTTITS